MEIPKFNIILIGDRGVGKTTYALKLNMEGFEILKAMGADIYRKDVIIDEIQGVYMIWDGAAPRTVDPYVLLLGDRYKWDGAIFIFDLTNKSSLNKINKWLERIRKIAKIDIPIIMVGNKKDLETQRIVSKEDAIKISQQYNLINYIEISAKKDINIENSFLLLIKEIVRK